MRISTDPANRVVMIGDAPDTWNGVLLTHYDLTADQETEWKSLPGDRGGTLFDGVTFTALPSNVVVIDRSDLDKLEKTVKAIALLAGQYANQLKLGTYTGSKPDGTKNISDVKADFKAIYTSLP